MNWDQIETNWVAMTHRVRPDLNLPAGKTPVAPTAREMAELSKNAKADDADGDGILSMILTTLQVP